MRTLGTLVVGIAVVAACGTEGGGDTSTSAPEPDVTTPADTGQEEPTTTAAPADDSATTTVEAMGGIHAADSDLGSILVDSEGFTLYVFTQDSGGESACYDQCADNWPAVAADTAISSDLDTAIFGSTQRSDGTTQLTVNGMPVYLFAADTAPGDVNGQGVNDVWFVVGADGNMLEASATAPSGDEDIAYDYDY